MWDVFSFTYPRKKDKKWYLLLHQSRFPLEYGKRRLNILQKGYEAYRYLVQLLTWSGVYLRSTFSNTLLHKVLKLVPMTATGPEVLVATMTAVISNSYGALEDTLTHMNSIKLKSYPGENIKD